MADSSDTGFKPFDTAAVCGISFFNFQTSEHWGSLGCLEKSI